MYSETFKAKVVAEAIERIAEGESMNMIAPTLGVTAGSIYNWINADPEVFAHYARAREVQADVIAEQVLDIADENPAKAFKDIEGDDKTVVMLDASAVNHQRLRIDARKWFASKVAPKKWGDKLDVEHTGNLTFTRTVYAELEHTPALPVPAEALPAPSTKGSGRWD